MTEISGWLSSVLAIVLLRFVWQGALIGLLAWLALGLLRNAKPQARYAVACAALVCCAVLPLWQLAALTGEADRAVSMALPLERSLSPDVLPYSQAMSAAPALPADWLGWVVIAWALGTGLLSLRMAGGLWWVRRLRASAAPASSTEWTALQALVDRLALRMGVLRRVSLRITEQAGSPLSAGWLKPVVLFPAALALRMPSPLIEALLAHELAHIRRHDYLINLVQCAIEVLLFYHPVVWWLSRQIRKERELVADQLAAEMLGDPRRLATALFEIGNDIVPGAAIAQFAQGGPLMIRIQELLRPQRRSVAGAIVLPALGLSLASFALYANAHLLRDGQAADEALAVPAVPAVPALPELSAPPAVPAIPALPAAVASANKGHRTPRAAITPVAPIAPIAPVAPVAPLNRAAIHAPRMQLSLPGNGEDSFGMVRRDRDGILMSGQLEDARAIQALREAIPDDFIWYRRDGKAHVIRDAAVLSRAAEIWKPADELDRKMQRLSAQMEPHERKVQEIQSRMDQVSRTDPGSEAIQKASGELQVLANKQRDLAEGRVKLELALLQASPSRQDDIRADLAKLDRDQQHLEALMNRQSALIEKEADRLHANYAPMQGLQREIEVATAPMQQIGREMETLGRQIERTAGVARNEMQQLIDRSERQGLAEELPNRR